MAGTEISVHLRSRWEGLLAWLESRGFQTQNIPVECREITYASGNGLFARSACMPGSHILIVPPEALMNKMTLRRLYPLNAHVDKALSAIQLISMHLFIWRPKPNEDSTDPFFGPYISTLPRDFGGHPLTWLVLSKFNKMNVDDPRVTLLESLPPSVLAALSCLHVRFWADWYKQTTPSVAPRVQVLSHSLEDLDLIMDFMWAWLNVNTRCLYYRLKHAKTDPDNVTMCPIVDFANHTPGQARMVPVPPSSEIWSAVTVNPIGDGFKFICPDDVKIEKDDEIFLTYGLHSNKTLFVEYGFVNPWPQNGCSLSGEVDVQDLVEKYVFVDVRLSEATRVVLVAEGYWGDWTLYMTPQGAQPSWRLIAALRLYHSVVAVGSANQDTIRLWREVIIGKRRWVSDGNEQSWRRTVVLLCDLLIKRGEKSVGFSFGQSKNGWVEWMSENVQSLWREELFVAKAVKECVLRGDEF